MSNIIAICGHTCTAKTQVARALSRISGYKVMHPGEAAKTAALVARLPSVADLPDDVLREIDADTVAATANAPMTLIIESGFVDCAIPNSDNVFMVRLTADANVRQARFEQRKEEGGGRTRQLGTSAAAQDESDAGLRARLYGDTAPEPAIEIDTSELSVEDCAQRVWEAFVAAMGDTDVAGPHHASAPYRFKSKGKG